MRGHLIEIVVQAYEELVDGPDTALVLAEDVVAELLERGFEVVDLGGVGLVVEDLALEGCYVVEVSVFGVVGAVAFLV